MNTQTNLVPLTRPRVGELLRRWGGHLPAGYSAEVILVGGAWLVLHRLRRTTFDLDVMMGSVGMPASPDFASTQMRLLQNLEHNVLHTCAQRAITDFVKSHPRLPIIRRAINEDLVGTGTLPERMCIGDSVRIRGNYDSQRKQRGFLTVHLPTPSSILASKLNDMRAAPDYADNPVSQDRDDISALLDAQGIDRSDPVAVTSHLALTAARHFVPNRLINGPQRYVAASMGINPLLVGDIKVRTLARTKPERLVAAIRRLG